MRVSPAKVSSRKLQQFFDTGLQASVGRQHAVLVTRGGELFTWGSGSGGKLGLGHTMDACSPQRVHTLWGQTIQHVAAGGEILSPGGMRMHMREQPFSDSVLAVH